MLFVGACGPLALHSTSAAAGILPNKQQGAVPRKTRTLGSVGEADVPKDSSWKHQRTYRSISSPTDPQKSGIK